MTYIELLKKEITGDGRDLAIINAISVFSNLQIVLSNELKGLHLKRETAKAMALAQMAVDKLEVVFDNRADVNREHEIIIRMAREMGKQADEQQKS